MKMQSKLTVNPEQHKTTQKAAPLKATTKSTFQVATPSLVKSIKETVALKVAPKVASKVKAAVKPVVTTISSKSHSHQTKAFRGSVKSPQLAQVINTASIKACPKTPTPISKAKIENTKPLVSKSEPFLSYSNAVKGLRQEFSSLPELKCKETQTIGIVNNDASKVFKTNIAIANSSF